MLFQSPVPILTYHQEERLRLAIRTVAPNVTVKFYAPFGINIRIQLKEYLPEYIHMLQQVIPAAILREVATWGK